MRTKTRRYYIYYLARILIFFMGLVPLKVSLVIADFLGKAAFRFVRKYREIAIANLDAVFGGDHVSNVKIAEGVFRNLAKNGAEWVKLSSSDPRKAYDPVIELHGSEHLDDVLSEGKGALLMASHFGNWELITLSLTNSGYSGTIMAKKVYFHKYNEFVVNLRGRGGVNIVYRDESPKKFLKVLRSGNILAVLADQDVDSVDGVFVDFFGKPAYTPTAPVKLAMAAKTKIIPIFVIRKRDNTHKVIIEKPIERPSGDDKEEVVKKYTQAWTDVLEKYVREYPEQWVWLHPRWKTKEKA